MCNWSDVVRTAFESSVKVLVKDGVSFDTLIVRDIMRGVAKIAPLFPPPDISYGDVFSELWHLYRKGGFGKRYIVATKNVLDAQGKLETTVQYLPAKVWLSEPSRRDMKQHDDNVKRAARRNASKAPF